MLLFFYRIPQKTMFYFSTATCRFLYLDTVIIKYHDLFFLLKYI